MTCNFQASDVIIQKAGNTVRESDRDANSDKAIEQSLPVQSLGTRRWSAVLWPGTKHQASVGPQGPY